MFVRLTVIAVEMGSWTVLPGIATFAYPEIPTMIAARKIMIACQNLAFFRIPSKDFERPTRAEAMKKMTKASRIFVPISA